MPKNGRKKNKNIVKKIEKKIEDMSANKTKIRKGNKKGRVKPTVIGQALRTAGGLAGAYFGMPGLGRQMGAGISRVFGQGDYVVNSPSYNTLISGGVPAFSPLNSGFRIKHREYIQDIQSSTAFSSTNFQINPGLQNLFPWLSSIAINFEEYRIHGMVIYLNSLSATAVGSTNTALGLWGCVTQYDPSEPAFTNKQQCENYVGCQTTVPSCSVIHGIECKPDANVLNKYFVRSGDILSDEDLKFYDIGFLQIFSQGAQAASNVGEMWISYDIEFFKPRLPVGNQSFVETFIGQSDTANAAQPFGPTDGFEPISGSNLDVQWTTPTTLTLTGVQPKGIYLMTATWNQVTNVSMQGPVLSVSNSTGVNIFRFPLSVNQNHWESQSASQNRITSMVCFKKINDSDIVITCPAITNLTTSSVTVIITRLSDSFSPTKIKKEKLNMSEISELRKILEMVDGGKIDEVLGLLKRVPELTLDSPVSQRMDIISLE
jgi:hypothetical protein